MPIFFHDDGLALLLNLSNQARTGTRIPENIKVHRIPKTSVIPTVLMGTIGTKPLIVSTPKPIIVVIADNKTAFPVVPIVSITAS